MHPIKRFNIRVYGLLINDDKKVLATDRNYGALKNRNAQILIADEIFKNGNKATKFPGGGLEFGEGLIDGLKREYKEETGIDITVTKHFYTTDFFQPSFFDNESQVISIYYLCESADWKKIKTSETKFDFDIKSGQEGESFRWVNVRELVNETDLVLPIDKVVVKMLLEEFSQ